MNELPVTYTLKEIATIWQVNTETVRRWVRDGRIKTITVPGTSGPGLRHRVTQDELDRLLHKARRSAP